MNAESTPEGLPSSLRAPPQRPSEVLCAMAKTFEARNDTYGDNWRVVGQVMAALHPGRGVSLADSADHELFHLWSLLIVKITRFAASNLSHIDSMHDAAVYAAMIESILQERAR